MGYPQLVTAAEFDLHVMPSTAFVNIDTPQKDAAARWASSIALGFVRKRKVLPLLSWGDDLKSAVGDLMAYKLMGKRGYSPTAGANSVIRQSYDDAMAWLRDVSRGITELVDCIDSTTTPNVDEAGPLAAGDPIVSFDYQTRFGARGGGCCGNGRGPGNGL